MAGTTCLFNVTLGSLEAAANCASRSAYLRFQDPAASWWGELEGVVGPKIDINEDKWETMESNIPIILRRFHYMCCTGQWRLRKQHRANRKMVERIRETLIPNWSKMNQDQMSHVYWGCNHKGCNHKSKKPNVAHTTVIRSVSIQHNVAALAWAVCLTSNCYLCSPYFRTLLQSLQLITTAMKISKLRDRKNMLSWTVVKELCNFDFVIFRWLTAPSSKFINTRLSTAWEAESITW